MSSIGVILLAVGVFGLTWLFASNYTGAAKAVWSPIAKLSLAFRIIIGGLSIWVMLTAGGIARLFGLIALVFAALHSYFTRPDQDLGMYNSEMIPRPFRWLLGKITALEKMLFRT